MDNTRIFSKRFSTMYDLMDIRFIHIDWLERARTKGLVQFTVLRHRIMKK